MCVKEMKQMGTVKPDAITEQPDRAAFYSVECTPAKLMKREYDISKAYINGESIDLTPGVLAGFPPPAPFFIGLRPYIYMAPLTMIAPPAYLISCLETNACRMAFAIVAFLAVSGYRLGQSDAIKARSRGVSPYMREPNPLQLFYLMIFIPVWGASSFGGLFSPIAVPRPLVSIALFLFFLFLKLGLGMSIVLHRYCSHAAFKCHWVTNLVLGMIGCLAYQGGPMWWASRHRAHHKFCDTTPRDPHSPALIGIVNAFSFFLSGETPDDVRSVQAVDEEFSPSHIDTPGMRLIDSLSFLFPLMEFYLATYFFGAPGLWVSFSSSWVSQVGTVWFNVRNHPVGGADSKLNRPIPSHRSHRRTSTTNVKCDAIDFPSTVDSWPLYVFLDGISCIIAPAVGEDEHDHHHSHPALAIRPGFDAPHYFVTAMAACGLIWNVQSQGNSGTDSQSRLTSGSRTASEASVAEKTK